LKKIHNQICIDNLRYIFSKIIFRSHYLLKNTNQAEKYAQQENPGRIRDFLKKIGSNFRIAGRTLVCDFKNAWIIAEKYHDEAQRAGETSYDFAKSESWLAIANDVRTRIIDLNEDIFIPELI
jgi:hypothetical protein